MITKIYANNPPKVEAPRLRQAIGAIGPFVRRFSLNSAPVVTSPYDASFFEMHEDGIQFRRRLGVGLGGAFTNKIMYFGSWDVNRRWEAQQMVYLSVVRQNNRIGRA